MLKGTPYREIHRFRIKDKDLEKEMQAIEDGGKANVIDFVLDRVSRSKKWPQGMSVTNAIVRNGYVVVVLE